MLKDKGIQYMFGKPCWIYGCCCCCCFRFWFIRNIVPEISPISAGS